jgi:hypothetical protein
MAFIKAVVLVIITNNINIVYQQININIKSQMTNVVSVWLRLHSSYTF